MHSFFSLISFTADRVVNGSAKSTIDLTVNDGDEIVLREFDPSDSTQRICEDAVYHSRLFEEDGKLYIVKSIT